MKFVHAINDLTQSTITINMDKVLLFSSINNKTIMDLGDRNGSLILSDSIEDIIQKIGPNDMDYFIELHAWVPPSPKSSKNKQGDIIYPSKEGTEIAAFINVLNISAAGTSKDNRLVLNFGPEVGDVVFTDDPEYVLPLFD